jgi:HEAT repeat protein
MPLIRKTPEQAAKPLEPAADLAVGLAVGLADASPDARWAAARAAAERPEAVAALAQALARENDARVREAIFTAFARIATSESAVAVLPYVRSDDASLRTGALDALRAMPAVTEQHLPQLFADPDSDVRLLACDLARVMTGAEVPKLLCGLLGADPQANVCAAAVEVLAEIGNADAVPSLARCAARFPDDPFLGFAVAAATERLTQHAGRG